MISFQRLRMEIIDITRHSNSLLAVEKSHEDFDQVRSLDFSNHLRYILLIYFLLILLIFLLIKKKK